MTLKQAYIEVQRVEISERKPIESFILNQIFFWKGKKFQKILNQTILKNAYQIFFSIILEHVDKNNWNSWALGEKSHKPLALRNKIHKSETWCICIWNRNKLLLVKQLPKGEFSFNSKGWVSPKPFKCMVHLKHL